jgi:NAD(P)-dependent dehydrogenase (short-subunit alcohol dehydrogenase family)
MDVDCYEELTGQVALVTGANRGIGREIAARLAGLGATVFAGVRSNDHETPEGTHSVLLDVTQEGDVEAVVDGIFEEAGRLDILVNNAGVGEFGESIVGEPVSAIDRTLATNLRGPMVLCKHALPLLLQSEGPRVVNLSSGMGAIAEMGDGSPAYRVSKTGLNGFTAYLDAEYDELVANAVCPGWVRTDMGGEKADRSVETGAETPVWLARFRADAPSGLFWRDREPIEW